jgi:hypothetical protein
MVRSEARRDRSPLSCDRLARQKVRISCFPARSYASARIRYARQYRKGRMIFFLRPRQRPHSQQVYWKSQPFLHNTLDYYLFTSCFPARILERASRKSGNPKELWLTQRRRDVGYERELLFSALCVSASVREEVLAAAAGRAGIFLWVGINGSHGLSLCLVKCQRAVLGLIVSKISAKTDKETAKCARWN